MYGKYNKNHFFVILLIGFGVTVVSFQAESTFVWSDSQFVSYSSRRIERAKNNPTVVCVATDDWPYFYCIKMFCAKRHDVLRLIKLENVLMDDGVWLWARCLLRSNAGPSTLMNNLWNMCRRITEFTVRNLSEHQMIQRQRSSMEKKMKLNKTSFADSTCIGFLEHQIHCSYIICVRRWHVNLYSFVLGSDTRE